MQKVLVIANRTAGSDELFEELRARAERGPVHFVLVVPVNGTRIEQAQGNLARALERMRSAGIDVEGRAAAGLPFDCVEEAWDLSFDELLVATLDPRQSTWLGHDLLARLRRLTGARVTHLVATESHPPVRRSPPPRARREQPGVMEQLLRGAVGGGPRRRTR